MPDRKACDRQEKMNHWLQQQLAEPFQYMPASSDASFRRYFRVQTNGNHSFILMDAPPEHEDVSLFLHTARLFKEAGLNVPEIIATNLAEGFLLLTDFGNTLYLDALNDQSVDNLYAQAMNNLIRLQQYSLDRLDDLPPYSEPLLLEEMQLFEQWFLRWLEIPSHGQVHGLLHSTYFRLLDNILNQTRVWVHRDFHSRNLMVTENDCPAILDFQDAVSGPATYDLASLLRDSYIQWPTPRVHDWSRTFFRKIRDLDIISNDISAAQWQQDFDWMSAQRHLKVLGIFCRLSLRDKKGDYLQYLPRTFHYLIQSLKPYPEFSHFIRWLQETVEPAMLSRIQST